MAAGIGLRAAEFMLAGFATACVAILLYLYPDFMAQARRVRLYFCPIGIDPRWLAVVVRRVHLDGRVAFEVEVVNKTRHPIFFESINASWFSYRPANPLISVPFRMSVCSMVSCKALIPIDESLLPSDGWKFSWSVYGWNKRAPPPAGQQQIVAHGIKYSNVEES